MMRISPREFHAHPLRAHAFLRDVPLEDVWAIRLRGGGDGRTIEDVGTVLATALAAPPAVVKGLLRLRRRLGARFGWDQKRSAWASDSYLHRLSAEDRANSTVAPGTQDRQFTMLYRFDNEQLSELRNATVHAFSSLSIQRTPDGYLAYLAVYVRPVHRFTRLYMKAIAPFRHLVVYPAMIRKVEGAWAERYR